MVLDISMLLKSVHLGKMVAGYVIYCEVTWCLNKRLPRASSGQSLQTLQTQLNILLCYQSYAFEIFSASSRWSTNLTKKLKGCL